jgi:hypothetical protein
MIKKMAAGMISLLRTLFTASVKADPSFTGSVLIKALTDKTMAAK